MNLQNVFKLNNEDNNTKLLGVVLLRSLLLTLDMFKTLILLSLLLSSNVYLPAG